MSWTVIALVLAAAALHAAWNTGVKAGGSPEVSTARLCLGGLVIALVAAPLLPVPDGASWPFLALSVAIHLVYFRLTAAAYARADLSLAYPMMRGGGVMVTAIAAPFVFADTLSLPGLVGVGLVGLALASLAWRSGSGGMAFIIGNALTIGAYSVTDGLGARASGAPLAYTVWVFALSGLVNLALLAPIRPGLIRGLVRPRDLVLGLAGAAASVGSYGLVLTAMTMAPVALVAALRETSMLFATAFAAFLLHERVGRRRVMAAVTVAAGAIAIKLA